MSLDHAELGKRLRNARESVGMTQEQVADQIQLSRATIAQIELGNRSVTGLELGKFAYLYGRDIREFLAKDFSEEDVVAVLLRSEGEQGDGVRQALRDCIALGHELSGIEAAVGVSRTMTAVAAYQPTLLTSKWEAIQSGTHVASEERRRLGLGIAPLGDIAALLESQGVRTGVIPMSAGVSGLMLSQSKLGFFVVVNQAHPAVRQRFSLCHEYAHLLLDRGRNAHVTRDSERGNLLEVRANVFAASFLMPEEGVRLFVAGLGKGNPSRIHAEVFDEVGSIAVDSRTTGGTQDLQLYDVIQLAHHFGVSVLSTLYRLRNLKLLTEPLFENLKIQDHEGNTQKLEGLLGYSPPQAIDQGEFHRRYLVLALEAYRREKISRRKLIEVGQKLSFSADAVQDLLDELGLVSDESADVLLPAEA